MTNQQSQREREREKEREKEREREKEKEKKREVSFIIRMHCPTKLMWGQIYICIEGEGAAQGIGKLRIILFLYFTLSRLGKYGSTLGFPFAHI